MTDVGTWRAWDYLIKLLTCASSGGWNMYTITKLILCSAQEDCQYLCQIKAQLSRIYGNI